MGNGRVGERDCNLIQFRIERRSGVSPYMQIVYQTRQAMHMGVLKIGDKLPAVREVVDMTAVNPNTVLKAYRHLEHEGLVESRSGVGCFVRRDLIKLESGLESPLGRDLRDWMARSRQAGLERGDVEALIKTVIDIEYGPSS